MFNLLRSLKDPVTMKKHHPGAAAAQSTADADAPASGPAQPGGGSQALPDEPARASVPDTHPAPELKARLTSLEHERDALDRSLRDAQGAADEAGRRSAATTRARDELQAQCRQMAGNAAGPPAPFDKLGQAMVAAVAAYDAALQAQATLQTIQSAGAQRLAIIDGEIGQITRKLRRAELAALVAEFERRVQAAKLGHLSDQIRDLARQAGVDVEAHSPLLDPEHIVLTGYPVQAWAR